MKARGDLSIPAIVRRRWRDEYEWGLVDSVRFTLRAEDFEPWSEVITRCPEWSPEQIRHVKTYPIHRTWRCRTEPLALERWLAVETKAYRGQWRPFDYRKPEPERDAVVQAYLTEQAILSRQPDYECQCGGTVKAIDANDMDDIECPCCGNSLNQDMFME